MRICVHDYAGHAFQVQLSRALAGRGHDVLHLYAASNPTPKGALVHRAGDAAGLAIEGLSVSSPYERYAFVKRWRHEVAYGRILARRAADWRPDVVISCNTPLESQRRLQSRCRRLGIPVVFWVQDLLSVATERILRRRIPVLGRWIGRYYKAMERRLARRSQAVVVISKDFAPLLRGWGVPDERLFVIENWAPLDEIQSATRDNAWAREHGLVGKTCFLYSGMMGLKHDPKLLRRLAVRFRDRQDVAVVVVSEGLGADWLLQRNAEERLENLTVLGFQPYERLAEVLASADVLVAVLEPDAGVFSVPSKVLSYLCAGRALLAAIPAENLAARIVSDNEAGLVVDPGNAESFVRAAERLTSDAALREGLGRNARAYAERTFDIERITDRFEGVIREATGRQTARDPRSARGGRPVTVAR